MKNVLEYSGIEAREFFLKEESYFNFDLPKYFVFQDILERVSKKIEGKLLSDFLGSCIEDGKKKATYPCNFENVNYKLLNNKDGKFAWRPLQLIHPALYVSLVHKITEQPNWETIVAKFKEFGDDPKIQCFSIPVESEDEQSDKAEMVSHWWQEIEQRSIQLALNYDYILHTDISDCYGSIYTHSIVWALHTKAVSKKDRNNPSLIGNVIDNHLQDMSYGQTNGIPQGSTLMDLIAEMVLGYVDLNLSERVKLEQPIDFQIIRFRDDYRIFTNNPQDAELILKHLTEILIELGMRLNAQKTNVSNDVVKDSIKPDKLFWILNTKMKKNLQNHLLIIHELSQKFPNSGSVNKALNKFYYRIENLQATNQNLPVLISILIDITFKSPRTYPVASAILSKFLSLIENVDVRDDILESITKRFEKIPNTGHIQIWLQRVVLKCDRHRSFEEPLCKRLNDPSVAIWNSDWLNKNLQKMINSAPIIDEEVIGEIDEVIGSEEVELFESKTYYPN
jgi:RNA-directed DNA polymerase